ncbi:MAG: SusC/RagA family TonB-linked outer membrane protein [Prevotellaceae bacterium]|nr:SusC/RagA family TonB-linked outer membrane protein [Prevotellaceae bacterium]
MHEKQTTPIAFKKWGLSVCALLLFAGVAWAQNIQVTGQVTDRTGEGLPGVYVLVQGATTGTSTGNDGRFAISAPSSGKLVFSSLGMVTQTVDVNGRAVINVQMAEDALLLQDVVITAMGIKKERKALGYAVSDVNAAELMKNKNPNIINSLAGKVPGVNITQYSGAAGAGASITIRGGNSTSESRSNQPLFVVDGIIYDNSTSVLGNTGTDGMSRSNTTYSNRVMDINPEDIENMSVLKGAAAAALYGSRAADGVIIITTKKGAEGTISVDFTSKYISSWANKLPEVQTQFGRGSVSTNGAFNDITYSSWGDKLASNAATFDNIGNFFNNSTILDNNVSLSGGTKNSSFYLSLSNFDQAGVIPNTGYDRTTIRFNGEQKYGRLTVTANSAFSIANTDRTLTSSGLYNGGGSGAMSSLYTWPTTENMSKYLKEDGTKYRLFEGVWDLADDKENPYWIINKFKMTDKTARFTGSLQGSFVITDWWDVIARVGYDQYTTDAYGYIAPGSSVLAMYQNGRLSKTDSRYAYLSTNIMTNFHKTIEDFDFNLLLGSQTDDFEWLSQTHWGYNFITAGTISFSNIARGNQFFTDGTTNKRLVGVYGEFRASYKRLLYLTVSGRNDWSSTLPLESRSYFYPSVSGSFVFSELLKDNSILSFGKIRASLAQVGKDANAYATQTRLVSPITYGSFIGVGNYYERGNPFLVPEIQKSWEIGAELRFLNGRLGLDYTYYHQETENQIAAPRLTNAGGYIMTSINSGSVVNKGMELSITGKPVAKKDFEWDVMFNFSYNRGTLGQFLAGVEFFYPTDAQFGTVRAASVPNGGYFLALTGTCFIRETEKKQTGIDASGNPIMTDVEIKNGRYQVDPNTGLYRMSPITNTVVGNREPQFNIGLNNNIRYKDLTLSFLLDVRKGGIVYNGTEYAMCVAGLGKRTTENDREFVTVSGVNSQNGEPFEQTYKKDQTYNINGVNYSGRYLIQQYWSNHNSNSYNFITDVNWLKLRSLSISYDLSNLIKKQDIIKRLSVVATGTNLFTWTNYVGMDPEVSTAGGTGGSGATGIDYCSVPAISSFSFGVNVKF